MPYNDEDGTPSTWSGKLRAVADWLDLTDPIVTEYLKQYGPGFDAERLPEALACLDGDGMQVALRRLADILEAGRQ
jgi:hypothetical protein